LGILQNLNDQSLAFSVKRIPSEELEGLFKDNKFGRVLLLQFLIYVKSLVDVTLAFLNIGFFKYRFKEEILKETSILFKF